MLRIFWFLLCWYLRVVESSGEDGFVECGVDHDDGDLRPIDEGIDLDSLSRAIWLCVLRQADGAATTVPMWRRSAKYFVDHQLSM